MLTDEEVKMLKSVGELTKEAVKNFLRDNKDKWFTEEEIARDIGASRLEVYKALSDLKNGLFVKYVDEIWVDGEHYYRYRVSISDTGFTIMAIVIAVAVLAIGLITGGLNG